jgi:flavorubredoxin
MSLVRVVGLMSLLVAAAASFGTPAGAFESGGWEGGANTDETGKFSDCTMTADYQNGITLAFIISRDFGGDWSSSTTNGSWTSVALSR